MLTIKDILDKFRSISVDSINDFLTRNDIEHKRTDLNVLEFKLENWRWDLYIYQDYIKVELVLFVPEEMSVDKEIAREACLEVTKRLKVLKLYYTSRKYRDKYKDNEVVECDIFLFSFESFCFSMFEFGNLFYNGIYAIIGGQKEYNKLYDEMESKKPKPPVGFTNFISDSSSEKPQTTNRRRVGYV